MHGTFTPNFQKLQRLFQLHEDLQGCDQSQQETLTNSFIEQLENMQLVQQVAFYRDGAIDRAVAKRENGHLRLGLKVMGETGLSAMSDSNLNTQVDIGTAGLIIISHNPASPDLGRTALALYAHILGMRIVSDRPVGTSIAKVISAGRLTRKPIHAPAP